MSNALLTPFEIFTYTESMIGLSQGGTENSPPEEPYFPLRQDQQSVLPCDRLLR